MAQTGSAHELPTHHSREAKAIAEAAQSTASTGVASNDPRLTDSREWTAETISQAEAETGSATTRRAWTAQRVFQAIASWWAASSAATKLATIQSGAQVNRALGTTAGTDCEGNDARLSDQREWSAATVSQATAEAGTDTTRLAWTALRVRQAITAWWATVTDVVKTTANQNIGGIKTFLSRSVHAGAYTPSATPAHSATPTFDAAASNVFEPAAMTSNVTSITISNAVAGQTIQIRFQQDGAGGRTVAVPAGAKIDGTPNTAASRVNWLIMTYSSVGGRWEGNWLTIPA